MGDLLTFLTGTIKQRGITVNEFCNKLGISRQKFYRFMREPKRFTEKNVEDILSILQLNEAEAMLLRSYLQPGHTAAFLSELSNSGQPDYSAFITGILHRRPSEELNENHYYIEYLDASGTSSVYYTPEDLARVITGVGAPGSPGRDARDTASTKIHDYDFTIYNCLSCEEPGKRVHAPSSSILTIAQLLIAIDALQKESERNRIRIRHYLKAAYRTRINDHDSANAADMCFNFNLLNDVLPLLSVAEDYKIDNAGVTRRFLTEQANLCLIEHRVLTDDAPSSAGDPAPKDSSKGSSEYFALLFSENGECSACCLGSEPETHIYRFLSLDIRDKRSKAEEKAAASNPNQAYSEYAQNLRIALIHPDLCFDDIPREMWYSLFDIVEASDSKALFEAAFRGLMDPYSQYDFLDFESLVRLAVDTLEQRYAANSRNGKIVICHPEGLHNLVRTGLITDLQDGGIDYKGQSDLSTPLRFPVPLTKKLLELVRASIVRRQNCAVSDPSQYDWVNYYILQPQYPYPEVTFGIYREFGLFSYYTKSRYRHVNTNSFSNPAIGTTMYDYIINEMVAKRGQKFDSDILSDEHSIALIDKLILELERENP